MLKKKHPNLELPIEVAHPSISVTTVFSIVGILFLVLVFALYFFRYNSASPFYQYYNKKPAANISLNSSLDSSLQTGINKTASGKSVELRLTEAQIGAAICISCDTFPLKKGTLKMTPDGIVISGKTTTAFWGVNLDIIFKPKAENGQIVFELTEFKAAGVSAPPKITSLYSDKLKGLFINIIPAGQSIKITEVHSLVGSILIIGTKR